MIPYHIALYCIILHCYAVIQFGKWNLEKWKMETWNMEKWKMENERWKNGRWKMASSIFRAIRHFCENLVENDRLAKNGEMDSLGMHSQNID